MRVLRCPRDSSASDHLDLLRGVTAVSVMLGHARAIFCVDYSQLPSPGPAVTALYAATAFGHHAVMVFFVLSGFFVGGGVLATAGRRWDGWQYAVNRFTRLYVVLVPGLALTAAWDAVGGAFAPGVYAGQDNWAIGYSVPDRTTPVVLVGNLAYLQTLLVPTFGSNGPLWSLANEFWYYVVFPLLAFPLLAPRRGWQRYAYPVAGVVALCTLLRPLAPYFVVWLLGVLVAVLPGGRVTKRKATAVTTAAAIGLVGATLATRVMGVFAGDTLVGLAAAVLVYCLVTAGDAIPSPPRYGRAARALAGFSFTLYVVHLPALAAARAVLFPGRKLDPGSLPDVAAFVAVVVGVLAYSRAVSGVTEAYTDRVRAWLTGRLTAVRGAKTVKAPA